MMKNSETTLDEKHKLNIIVWSTELQNFNKLNRKVLMYYDIYLLHRLM